MSLVIIVHLLFHCSYIITHVATNVKRVATNFLIFCYTIYSRAEAKIERRAHISAEPNATRNEIEETIRAICAARGEIYTKLTHITE